MWSLRIAASRLRPINAAAVVRITVVVITFALFLYGDFALFRRLFRATAQIEEATPFFALAILRNMLAMVFLVATIVLFSSAMTAAIGAFFTDLDLDIYHAAPRSKLTLVITRWLKTLVQSATIIFAFIVPMLVAFARQYDRPWTYYPIVLVNLALLLSIPVTLACLTIVMLVRWFPVRRVHQIVATIAILVLTVTVVAFRVSRPERLFTEVRTDNLVAVLQRDRAAVDRSLSRDRARRRHGLAGAAGLSAAHHRRCGDRVPAVRVRRPRDVLHRVRAREGEHGADGARREAADALRSTRCCRAPGRRSARSSPKRSAR